MSQVGVFSDNASGTIDIVTITGNTGGAVGPDAAGNINVLGTGSITIAGTPGTNTETVQLTGLTNHSLLVGAGTATITNLGVATNGQLAIGSTGANPVLAAPTNGSNISWSTGAGSLTANLSGTTNHTIQIGNAGGSLTSLGVATNGQIAIGSTGADPVLATITAGANSSVTNASGSITIKSIPRVSSAASISSPLAVNTNNFDMYVSTAQSTDFTVSADSGTPSDGQKLIFRFLDNGSPRAITWTAGSSGAYQAVGITLPTTTTASKILYVGFIYDANASRWDGVSTVVQA